MDEFWKKRNKPSAAQLTGALGESVKEYLKKTELPGEKAAVTLNSFYPADAGTLVRTLEEIGGPEKRWSWQGGQAEDKTGYGGPAAQQRAQSGNGGWGQSGEPGFEQKVALVQQALQRDREAHRRQEGNHYTAGNTAGRGSGSFGGGNLSGESFSGAGAGGVPGGAAVGRSRPAFPTAGQGGAGQGAFHFPRTLPQDGRFESGRLNVPERSGVFGQGGAPRLPGWNEAQRAPVTYGPEEQWPQQAPYGMEQQREGERWQPPERSAPHTLPQPWGQREPWPVEPPQGGAATEPSRLALYGPREQEKMLRLLREKGLQTLLSGDTLEERNDGGQALLRLARLDADENAKASEGQDERTEYEPSSHKRDVAREWGVDPDELMWDFRKNGYVLEEDFIKSLYGDGEVAAIAGADPYYGPVRSAEPREEEKETGGLSEESQERYDQEMKWLQENRSDPAHAHVASFAEKFYFTALKKEEETGIPAEFILAQLALESNWGRSVPGEKGVLEESHNYAGIRSSENNPDPAGIVLSWSEEDHAYIAYKAFHNDEEFWDYYCNLLGTRYRTEGTIEDWARKAAESGYSETESEKYYKALIDVYGTLGFV